MAATDAADEARVGPRNAITDVAGILVGQAESRSLLTGASVVVTERPAAWTAVLSGGAAWTRGASAGRPGSAPTPVDAIVLSGGSAFGLDACGGAMEWLRSQGRGWQVRSTRVPIVTGAIIFDLLAGGDASWDAPPWWELGRAAAAAADREVRLGNAGAGLGATAGQIKGGTGTASVVFAAAEGETTVGALAIVNPLGRVTMPGSRAFWAWPFERDGEFGAVPPPAPPLRGPGPVFPDEAGANTTLVVVATDAALERDALVRLAEMARDGIARAIRPVHTPHDGDTVFALSTARAPGTDPMTGLARLGHHAADCVSRAIARGVHAAEGVAGIPAWRDLRDDGAIPARSG